jgi:signal transduction histidine kinase/Tfp pilus assembly protein PilF
MAECLKLQGIANYNLTNNDIALALYRRALKIAEEDNLTKMKGAIYNNMGVVYAEMGQLHKTIAYYEKSLAIRKLVKDMSGVGSSYSNLGNTYLTLGDYEKALSNQLKGLKIREELNDQRGIANSNSNIGNSYFRIQKYDKAFEYHNKALEVNKKLNNEYGMVLDYLDLGAIYYETKEYTKSKEYFEKGLALAEKIGMMQNVSVSLSNLGEISRILQEYDKSIDYYRKSLAICLPAGDMLLAASCYSGIGFSLVHTGKTAEGIALLKKGYNISLQHPDKMTKMASANFLYQSLEKTGDFKSALHYLKIAKAFEDSLDNENDLKKIQEIGFDYELNKKEEIIKSLMKEREFEKQRANLNRNLNYAFSLAAVLALAFIFMLYRSREKSRKYLEVTSAQNNEIRKQTSQLHALNEMNNKMFSIISHDLRNPIATLSNVLLLESENVISAEESKSMQHSLSLQVSSINLLLDNLLLWSKEQIEGRTAPKPEKIVLNEPIKNNVQLLFEMARQKNISFINNITGHETAFADRTHLDIILRNVLANAIKFSHKGGRITLDTRIENNTVIIFIKDEGTGMSEETLLKLLNPKEDSFSSKGTSGETGSGLGLQLCAQYATLNNGFMSFESEEGKGTTCIITLLHTG